MKSDSIFKPLINIILFRSEAIEQVADEESLTPVAGVFFVLSIILFSLAVQISYQSVSFSAEFSSFLSLADVQWGMTMALSILLMLSFLITSYLIHWIAQHLFYGKRDFFAFFRVFSFASVITWLFSAPVFVALFLGNLEQYQAWLMALFLLAIVAFFWMIPLFFRVIRTVYRLSTLSALAVFVMGLIILFNVNRALAWLVSLL